MREPSLRTSRLTIAGGLIAAIVVGGVGFVVGRSTAPSAQPTTVAEPAPVPTSTPTPIALPMDRGDIIALADAAADAMAAGQTLPASVDEAVGRRFTLHLPFGCDGPSPENSDLPQRWRYDAGAGALRIHVAPVTWQAGDWWRHGNVPKVATIEGFWVTHPWTSSQSCPTGASAAAAGFEPVTLPGQTLAIAQFFAAGSSRQAVRDGEPFQTVLKVARKDLRAEAGFRVRLTGKIGRVPGNGPVRCIQPAGVEQRPICVVAVSLDEVAIENSATGTTLATWTVGNSRPAPLDLPSTASDGDAPTAPAG
jgi:hypothetical protein